MVDWFNAEIDVVSIAQAPQQLKLFAARLPHKPYCSDDLAGGLRIRAKAHALRATYIQHNPPPLIAWLVYDLDRQHSADDWIAANLPPPAWITTNSVNGHSHIAYGLQAPVARTDLARQAPLRLAAAVEAAYRTALRADRGYSGLITKNPLHPSWRVWTPPSANGGIYDLGELAEYVDLPSRLPKRDLDTGLGRNVQLFDQLRQWAYVAVRAYWGPGPGGADAWHEAVLNKAEELNQFAVPLPFSEIRATAKSVAKWVWRHMTPAGLRDLIERTHSPEIQARRGRLGGKASGEARRQATEDKRASARLMAARGMTQRAIAGELGVHQSTVARWLQGG